MGLLEVEIHRRWFMRVILQIGLPFLSIYAIAFFGLILPASYGSLVARHDFQRMLGTPIQRVTSLQGVGIDCLQTQSSTCKFETCLYVYKEPFPEAHYLGQLGGLRLLLIFEDSDHSHICLFNDKAIDFMELAVNR